MSDGGNHAASVAAWLERSGNDLTPERLLQMFETALSALWKRARNTLGEITLAAIVDRVLYNAGEEFPAFASLRVGPNGEVECQVLREQAHSLPISELSDGIRFVLVELLTVIGNLTADILTPDLHAELARVATQTESEDATS